jgi:hypothetical protein
VWGDIQQHRKAYVLITNPGITNWDGPYIKKMRYRKIPGPSPMFINVRELMVNMIFIHTEQTALQGGEKQRHI